MHWDKNEKRITVEYFYEINKNIFSHKDSNSSKMRISFLPKNELGGHDINEVYFDGCFRFNSKDIFKDEIT